MNFLAHIYLSFGDKDLTIGNFIGDFVKGKAYEQYASAIQKGILLHREIDLFTDEHPIVIKTKERLRPKYHHYAPVISDVFYDHFLASMWSEYHEEPLLPYTESFYQLAASYGEVVPDKARRMLKYMARDNWLYHYQYIEGINRALTGMSQRTPYESKMDEASQDLADDYEAYREEFLSFFPELIDHCKKTISK